MKTKTLLLVSTLAIFIIRTELQGQITNHAIGRSAFNDAKNLSDTNHQDEILKAYDLADVPSIEAFNERYSTNLPIPVRKTVTVVPPGPQSASGGAALNNPTLGIDALGTFIARRFKQEINIAFLNKFRADVLDTTKLPGSVLGRVLPKTKMVLSTVDPYNYPAFLETLHQAFDEDVSKLPQTIPKILPALNPNDNASRKMQAVVLLTIMNVSSSIEVVTAINGIAQTLLTTPDDHPLKRSVYALALGINVVNKGGSGNQMFLGKDDIAGALDTTTSGYFAALLIRQNELYLNTLFTVDQIKKGLKFEQLMVDLIPIYNSLAKQADALASLARQDKLTPSVVQESVSLLIKSFRNAVNVTKGIFPNSNLDGLINVLAKAESLNDISRLIIDKKYGLVLLQTVSFLDNNIPAKFTPGEKQVIYRYINFVANVLSAETRDDLVQALETSANPVGSYRVKRNSTFNISFNAYAGGFAGSKSTFGFTAPVGIYFGWGNLGKDHKVLSSDNGKSIGLLLSLVDVGAVTAFRLKDEGTELADVSWENVFSPGAHLSFGFGKLPLSINAGGQLGPQLKSIDMNGSPVLTDKEWLFRLSLVVDIPIFDFYIRQRAYCVRNEGVK